MTTNVYHGDCIEIVPQLGNYDFIFADPPFNIGQDYIGYDDDMPMTEYESCVQDWIEVCWNACRGVMCLHGPDDVIELYLRYTVQSDRIAWINWHYRFGQNTRRNWIDTRCHCLIFARQEWIQAREAESAGKRLLNPESVLVESDRVKYGDSRVHETENGGRRLPGSVWGIPSDGPYWGRVQGNSHERSPDGQPNQLPEVYLERLIRAYTNEGDRCLDPFGGTGTTAVVADALNRHCDTIDVSMENCQSILRRIQKGAVRV